MCALLPPFVLTFQGKAVRQANTFVATYQTYVELPQDICDQICTVRMVSAYTQGKLCTTQINWNQTKSYKLVTDAVNPDGTHVKVSEGPSTYLGLTNVFNGGASAPLVTSAIPGSNSVIELTFSVLEDTGFGNATVPFAVFLEVIPVNYYGTPK